MSKLSARIVRGNKTGMTTKKLMGFRVNCTGVFDSKDD
jgi:hypothetical protein